MITYHGIKYNLFQSYLEVKAKTMKPSQIAPNNQQKHQSSTLFGYIVFILIDKVDNKIE